MRQLKYIVVFLMCLPLLSSWHGAHKFYVSITQIEYIEDTHRLQLITKLFIDDVEAALQLRQNKAIKLAKQNTPSEEEEEWLKNYIFQKLAIQANGSNLTLNYIGAEYEIDLVKIYIEVLLPEATKQATIENKALMEMFTNQQNIVHFSKGKSRRSFILEKENPKALLNFK